MPTLSEIQSSLRGLSASDRTEEEQRAINAQMGYKEEPAVINMPKSETIGEAWNAKYNPIKNDIRNNHIGLGADFENYDEMSDASKLKLMQSGYMAPSEFEDYWNKHTDKIENSFLGSWFDFAANPILAAAKRFGKGTFVGDLAKSFDIRELGKDAAKELVRAKNEKILQSIYTEDGEKKARNLAGEVSNNYATLAESNLSDDDVVNAFTQAITPGSYQGNLGIPMYAAFFGDGSDVQDEMKDFSIDDMRQVLAKKKTYEQYMSPQMASTVLNNEAQKYIKDRMGSGTRFGLWAKDTGISALSYSVDKVNGVVNLALAAEDKITGVPVVWVDDENNVVDPKELKSVDGHTGHIGEDGQFHEAKQIEIDRTTLHNMGKNDDGSENTSWLNPQYWTRAEQFGTLDEAEQKQYEKIGVSPYKVVYDPNEDTDIWYESAKMMSFGLADGASIFIPFGIGAAGRVLNAASKTGKVMGAIGKAMNWTGKMLGAESKFGSTMQGLAGAGGIAYAYQRGAFQETLAGNFAKLEEDLVNISRNEVYQSYQGDEAYRDFVDDETQKLASQMKAEYLAKATAQEGKKVIDSPALNEEIEAQAREKVLGQLVQEKITQNKQSDRYAQMQQHAINEAGDAAWNTFLPEAIKYGFVNTIGFRKFLYTNPMSTAKRMSPVFKGIFEKTTDAGKKRLATEGSKFLTRGAKMKEFGKILGGQVWGGAWTNGTDDMMVDAAEQMSADSFDRYLNAYENGEALADTYGFLDGLYSYTKGLGNSLGQETTWNAALVGGLGSLMSVTPNMANIAHLATKEGRQLFKENFQQRFKRNEDGSLAKDENGKPIIEQIGLKDNWRERAAYFVQNGVLNDYYGKKQNERTLQNHVDYVNNLLDDYEDFDAIEGLIASDINRENAEEIRDAKTMQFVKALHAVNTLNRLANSSEDPTTLSSVVMNAKGLIDRASRMEFNGEEEVNSLLGQYYSANPGIAQSDANNQKALYQISENAQELKRLLKHLMRLRSRYRKWKRLWADPLPQR